MKYKVIVWGIGGDYNKTFNLIRSQVEIIACISNIKSYETVDGKPLIYPKEIVSIKYDYLIICSFGKYKEIYEEAIALGINSKKIIDCAMF